MLRVRIGLVTWMSRNHSMKSMQKKVISYTTVGILTTINTKTLLKLAVIIMNSIYTRQLCDIYPHYQN